MKAGLLQSTLATRELKTEFLLWIKEMISHFGVIEPGLESQAVPSGSPGICGKTGGISKMLAPGLFRLIATRSGNAMLPIKEIV